MASDGRLGRVESKFREALRRHSGGRDISQLEPAIPELVEFIACKGPVIRRLPPYDRVDRPERRRRIRKLEALISDEPLIFLIANIAVFEFGAKADIYSEFRAALEEEKRQLDRRHDYKLTDPLIQRHLVACATILDDNGIKLSGWLFTATAEAVLELLGLNATDLELKLKGARQTVKDRQKRIPGK